MIKVYLSKLLAIAAILLLGVLLLNSDFFRKDGISITNLNAESLYAKFPFPFSGHSVEIESHDGDRFRIERIVTIDGVRDETCSALSKPLTTVRVDFGLTGVLVDNEPRMIFIGAGPSFLIPREGSTVATNAQATRLPESGEAVIGEMRIGPDSFLRGDDTTGILIQLIVRKM